MAAQIKVVPLGAGQDVGRSCLLLTIGGKNIMLDCGMHMGYSDHRRFPDFKYISSTTFNEVLDCIIISHFHLDHCGSLPYFTEVCGYDGPIYMTHPTKAIAPILLEDMRKVCVERKSEMNFFTSQDIQNCMRKVIGVDLHETIRVDDRIEIKAYYAGHVLGAAMFHIKVTDYLGISSTCVYTGDYNMTPDRHLGSAWIDDCEPDLLITESTYATTVRDSKRVHETVAKGGKVLVPVFALGRAQELLILIESYWERMTDLHAIPIYFSAGLTERANDYYKLFISWTNEKVKNSFVQKNMFDFDMIKIWKPEFAELPGPMVLFASPGMLHAGTSLSVFTKWCHDPLNMIIMPGYCVAGTVGSKVLAGEKVIDIDRFKSVQVNLQVKNLSFSAHADAKGILALITMSKAKNVMLVHGEKLKMGILKERIINELGIPCFNPANGVTCTINLKPMIPAYVSLNLVESWPLKPLTNQRLIDGFLSIDHNSKTGGSRMSIIESGPILQKHPTKLATKILTLIPNLLLLSAEENIDRRYIILTDIYAHLTKYITHAQLIDIHDPVINIDLVQVLLNLDYTLSVSWPSSSKKMAANVLAYLVMMKFDAICGTAGQLTQNVGFARALRAQNTKCTE